jgi:nucleoside-diphosphate-sugar epimerase
MTASSAEPRGRPSLERYLAADFARIGAAPLQRCARLAGARVYLSGATGFFGRNLLALFAYLSRGGVDFQVTALSRAPQRFLDAESWCRDQPWLQWCEGDVARAWPGEGQYDLMLHAAAETRAEAHLDKIRIFEDLLAGTRQALSFAAAHGVQRLLLTGSGAQYGAIPTQFRAGIPESAALACDTTKTDSAYAEGKRASELLAAVHADHQGLKVVNTRCFAFVGPGLPLDGHFAIGNFLQDVLQRRALKLATAGTATRSYLYGPDLAIWLLILLLEGNGGLAVNVGSDRPVTILELATRIRDLLGPSLEIKVGADRTREERHQYVPCIDLARSLGLDVWTNLDEAIVRTARWHQKGAPS